MGDDFNGESNSSFYDTQVNPATNNQVNYIANQVQAEELAHLEADMGRDVALKREEELKEGITEDEKNNQRFVEQMLEKYPYAFEEIINPEDGSKILYYKDAINTGSADGISQNKSLWESDFWKNNQEDASVRGLYQEAMTTGNPRIFNDSHAYFSKDGIFLLPKEIGKRIPEQGVLEAINVLKESRIIQNEQGGSFGPFRAGQIPFRDGMGRQLVGKNLVSGLFGYRKEQAAACIAAIKLSNMYHKYVYDNTADVREAKSKASAEDIFSML